MSLYYPQTTGGIYPYITSGTAATNVTAITFPQLQAQVGAPEQEDDLAWLRRRVREVTELAA